MERNEIPECAVCLQICNHPAELPCGHIFCFLCVKGVAILNKRCAMCRQEIPPDYLDNPVLLSTQLDDTSQPEPTEDTYQWYYEGRNGWWRYDERSNVELEAAYNESSTDCQLLLAGALYHIDFRTMLQYRRNDVSRRRRVKRDIVTAPAKGIAGIKIMSNDIENNKANEDATNDVSIDNNSESTDRSDDTQQNNNSDDISTVIPPPAEFDIVDSIRSLSLDNTEDVASPE